MKLISEERLRVLGQDQIYIDHLWKRDILNKRETCSGGHKGRPTLWNEDQKYRKTESAKTRSPKKELWYNTWVPWWWNRAKGMNIWWHLVLPPNLANRKTVCHVLQLLCKVLLKDLSPSYVRLRFLLVVSIPVLQLYVLKGEWSCFIEDAGFL